MSKQNSQNAVTFGALMMAGNRWGIANLAIGATYLIPPDAPHILFFTITANRVVQLPASPKMGDWFIIAQAGGAFTIDIQNSAGGAITPATAALAVNTAALVVFDGTVWRRLVL